MRGVRLLAWSLVIALANCAASAHASLSYYEDFYQTYEGNRYLSGAGVAGMSRVQLWVDDPGGNQSTYGNDMIAAFAMATGGEYRVGWYDPSNYGIDRNPYFYYVPPGSTTADWVFKTFSLGVSSPLDKTPYHATLDPWALSGNSATTTAILGDGTGLPPGTQYDELTRATQFLYGMYFEGRLQDAFPQYLYSDPASGNVLQEAIWALQDPNHTRLTLTAMALKTWAEQQSLTDHTYDNQVKVLNLWQHYDPQTRTFSGGVTSLLAYGSSDWDDDQTLREPVHAPEPGTVVTWTVLASMSLLAWRRAKARKA